MGQIMAVIVILVMIIFAFIPLSYLNANYMETEKVKQSMTLGAKVLVDCIEQEAVNIEEVGEGYERSGITDIKIDKEKLLKEFRKVIELNYFNQKDKSEEIITSILAKALVYQDKFFLADKEDNWSPPFFFTIKAYREMDDQKVLLYFNTGNNTAAYYDIDGNLVREDIGKFYIWENTTKTVLDSKIRNKIIIGRINQVVAQYTAEAGERNGLKIQIRNPDEADIKTSHLNVLEGLTFFVVYAENDILNIDSRDFKFKDYNVVGYTIH